MTNSSDSEMQSCLPFKADIPILFQHCDPAGIVFYPRYFEMLNQTVEEWFALGLDYSFMELVQKDGLGIPLVKTECEFLKAGRVGDLLCFSLRVLNLGRSSVSLRIDALRNGEDMLRAMLKLAFVDNRGEEMRSLEIPENLRRKMLCYKVCGDE